MYNAHETINVEPDRESEEKRKADDRKTKQKMELIRSKLKPHTRKVKNFYHIIYLIILLFF
jgi:cell division protein FtsL